MISIIENDLYEISCATIIEWYKFKDKTILVTGASGMLPSYIVYSLLFCSERYNLGTRVIAQVRNKTKGEDVFSGYIDKDNFSLLVQDVCNPYSINEHIDYIIHAASQASPKYYATDPVGTLIANVEGTINVLNLAKKNNSKSVLFFSSAEVYGNSKTESICEDDYGYLDPTNVRSCYAESKRMGEQLCCAWNAQYGTHAKIVRPFHTYGPNMSMNDGRVFADFVKNIVNGENIVLKSSGDSKRAFCYVTDATVAFIKILLDGKDSEAYNMGNPSQSLSIKELARILVGLYPERRLELVFDIDANNIVQRTAVNNVLPNTDKLCGLGWMPLIPVEEGFKRVIDSKLERNER